MFSYDGFGGAMTKREADFRGAHARWLQAKARWAKAVKEINKAKEEWDEALEDFLGFDSTEQTNSCAVCPFKEGE
jgi:hypothetical protein